MWVAYGFLEVRTPGNAFTRKLGSIKKLREYSFYIVLKLKFKDIESGEQEYALHWHQTFSDVGDR